MFHRSVQYQQNKPMLTFQVWRRVRNTSSVLYQSTRPDLVNLVTKPNGFSVRQEEASDREKFLNVL